MRRAILPILAACIGIVWPFWPRPALTHELISTTVLFDREIARILNKRCVACHSEKNLAFPLTTYEETRPWARAIEEETMRRHMPSKRHDRRHQAARCSSAARWVSSAAPGSLPDGWS